MKRSTMLALTGVMTMFLGACGENTSPKPEAATTTTTTINSTTPTPTTAPTPAVDEEKKAETAVPEQRADAGVTTSYGAAVGDAGSNNATTAVEEPAENAQTAPSDEDAAAGEMPSA